MKQETINLMIHLTQDKISKEQRNLTRLQKAIRESKDEYSLEKLGHHIINTKDRLNMYERALRDLKWNGYE